MQNFYEASEPSETTEKVCFEKNKITLPTLCRTNAYFTYYI